ncbi:HNH endonuclease signature motif containing protein [Bifidobacterium angulatum]|uniref:HNH endonuclease n=1 Tax=Bifidobacterium angulatum TaxID=1683 RepID=UPI00406C4607
MPHSRNYRDSRHINRRARNLARQRVLARQVPCAICDRPIDDAIAWSDPMSAEVDEIIPVSRGGSATDLRNLEKVHRCCNQLKSDKSLAWARRKAKGTPALKPTALPFMASDW